jgi:hypothetical protein
VSQREAMEKLLQAYAVSLEQVREFCSENDPDKLSALFTKQEEENFALFNYVNELNNEVMKLTIGKLISNYKIYLVFFLYIVGGFRRTS